MPVADFAKDVVTAADRTQRDDWLGFVCRVHSYCTVEERIFPPTDLTNYSF